MPNMLSPHIPHTMHFRMQGISKSSAKELLQIDFATPVLLFFGFVHEYKGPNYLLDALPIIREQIPDISLWIVGDFDSQKEHYLV